MSILEQRSLSRDGSRRGFERAGTLILNRKVTGNDISRSAELLLPSVNADKRTIDVCFTTGHKDLRSGWFGDKWFEELEVSSTSVRLDRLNAGASVLDTHNRWSIDGIIAVVERAWIQDGKGYATLRFGAPRDGQDRLWKDVAGGVVRNISVGYRVYKWLEIPGGDSDAGPTFRAIDWEPNEISFVPIGFDPGCQTRTRSEDPAVRSYEMEIFTRGESTMDKPVATPAPIVDNSRAAAPTPAPVATPAPVVDEKAARAAERERIATIRDLCKRAQLDDAVADKLIADDTAVDVAQRAIFDAWSKAGDAGKTVGTRVQAGELDEIKTRQEAITSALMHRYDPRANELTEPGRQFRGMSLLRIAEELVGPKSRGMSREELAHRALTTTDFPIVLANVGGKSLRMGYTAQPKTFEQWVRFGTLPDYKAMNRVQFGDAPDLKTVNENGEYEEGSIGEGKETIQLLKYGRILNISEETIVNDDLDAFSKIPLMLGAAGGRLESGLVYGVLLNNAAMADNVALFHNTHANLGSALAVGETGLSDARAKMRKQKTLDAKDPLDLEPAFLIVGPDKETEARKILSAQYFATKSGDVNVFANSMKLIVESRVTGNKWFVAAAPSQIDTVEVAYLDGMAGPQLTTKDKFESDGVKLRIKHVVGVKALDHRGLYYNPGA